MAENTAEMYTKTYSTFSGCDIVATFNGVVIGEIQSISFSISREKAPVYTMGSANPRSFSRGKRGIAGSLVFTIFDRDALVEELGTKLNEENGVQKFKAERTADNNANFITIEEWDNEMSEYAGSETGNGTDLGSSANLVKRYAPIYADEVLPFDITLTFANEYGQQSTQTIYGCEILNEGAGFSIDTVAAEKAYTFVARRIGKMKRIDENSTAGFSSTY